jgi:Zn-dependent membrane protease YugP
MFFPFFYSPGLLIVSLIGTAAIGLAQWRVRRTYRHWMGVRNSSGLTGQQIARQILDESGLHNIEVQIIDGELTDNYDPSQKVLNLSQGVAYNSSVAAEGIVAHEIGHAVQDARAYAPMRLRSAVVPTANLGTQLGFAMVLIGLMLETFRAGGGASNFGFDVAIIGLLLFSAVVVFHLVTLPVEVDASRRAMGLLHENGIVSQQDLAGTRSVLTAAAFTYVAALFATVLQLLYLALQVFSRRD